MYNQFFTIKPRISEKKRRKQNCTPEIIRPFPKATPRKKRIRRRKKRKSRILTSILEKNKIEQAE